MAYLSEWLQVMLGEIARKQEDERRAAEEDEQRRRDAQLKPGTPAPSSYLSTSN